MYELKDFIDEKGCPYDDVRELESNFKSKSSYNNVLYVPKPQPVKQPVVNNMAAAATDQRTM